jgi:hypothetical protein
MSIQTFTSKESIGTRPRCIKIRFEQSNVSARQMAADYGALSNKMDVMQESYNALEKTVTKRCKL